MQKLSYKVAFLQGKQLKIRNISNSRRHSWRQQTSINDLIGRMSRKWNAIVLHPIKLKIPLCSRGKLKILFLALFEPDSSVTKAKSLCLIVYFLAYSIFGQVWIQSLTLSDIVFSVTSWFEFLPALHCVNCSRKSSLEFPRYYATSDNFARIPVVWYSRSKREDWVLSDKTPLYLERRRNPGNWRMELWLWRRFFQLNGCVRPEYKEPQALRLAWNLRKFLFWRGVIIQEIETKRTLFSSQHGSGILG